MFKLLLAGDYKKQTNQTKTKPPTQQARFDQFTKLYFRLSITFQVAVNSTQIDI